MAAPDFSLKLDPGGPPVQRPPGQLGIMDGSRVSDFSIERILSPQLGHKPPAVAFSPQLQGHPGGLGLESGSLGLESGSLRPPAPVQIPVGLLPYRGMSFGQGFYPCTAGCHHADFARVYSNSGVYCAGTQGYHGYHPAGVHAQSQLRQKARMRTVFTESQTKQLEALFDLTDYPTVEARAEVARSTGLSEETVRVSPRDVTCDVHVRLQGPWSRVKPLQMRKKVSGLVLRATFLCLTF